MWRWVCAFHHMVILKSNCRTVMRDSYHHWFLVIGSHRGTGITPLRWEVTKQQRVHQICACKYTKDPPYCDATHTNLPAQVLQQQEACPQQNANHHSNNKLCTGCGWVPDFWVFFIPTRNCDIFFKNGSLHPSNNMSTLLHTWSGVFILHI